MIFKVKHATLVRDPSPTGNGVWNWAVRGDGEELNCSVDQAAGQVVIKVEDRDGTTLQSLISGRGHLIEVAKQNAAPNTLVLTYTSQDNKSKFAFLFVTAAEANSFEALVSHVQPQPSPVINWNLDLTNALESITTDDFLSLMNNQEFVKLVRDLEVIWDRC